MTSAPAFGLIAHLSAPIESGSPFGPLTPYYRQLIEHALSQGWQGFVFSPRDVLRQRSTIWGWQRGGGTWQRAFVSMPTVCYTRLKTLSIEERDILIWLRDHASVQFLNQPELDEMVQDQWRVMQVLQSHPTLSPYIPDAVLLRDTQALSTLMAEHGQLTVRSRTLAGGKPSGSLTREGEELLWRQEVRGSGHARSFRSPVKLRVALQDHFNDTIVASYIPPFRIDSCPVVFRSLWQRGRTGQWSESFVVLRIGQPESQTYQAVTAGLLDRYQRPLQELLGTQYKAIRYQLTNLGRTVVDLLAQRSHGAGEIAIEFLLTATRELKILDISTLGGLEALRRLPDPSTAQTVMRSTLQYSALLSEQLTTTSVPSSVPSETR